MVTFCFCCYLWVGWGRYHILFYGDIDRERYAIEWCDAVESCSDFVGLRVRIGRWRYVGWMRCLINYICDGDGDGERNCIGGMMCLNLILTARA